MTRLSSIVERLARPPEDVRAENLRRWASSVPETRRMADVEPRCGCRVAGVVKNIRIDPREGRGSIEATFVDGTGEMVAKWLGRPSVAGIRLGIGLVVSGTPGRNADGDLVILNPEYELVPGPEHG